MKSHQGRAEKEKAARRAFEAAYEIFEAGRVTEAKRAYEYAARLGSPHAQINLGNLYDDRRLGTRDRERARMLYRRAFSHGLPEAAYNLAQLYRKEGSNRWYEFWIKRASELGDSDAKIELRAFKKPAAPRRP